MILKIFGFLDMFAALLLFLLKFGIGKSFVFIIVILLILKSLLFFSPVMTVLDIVATFVMVLAYFDIYSTVISLLFALWLLQKGFFSLLSP